MAQTDWLRKLGAGHFQLFNGFGNVASRDQRSLIVFPLVLDDLNGAENSRNYRRTQTLRICDALSRSGISRISAFSRFLFCSQKGDLVARNLFLALWMDKILYTPQTEISCRLIFRLCPQSTFAHRQSIASGSFPKSRCSPRKETLNN